MTMITPSYLGETIEYSSLHACRSTLEDPTLKSATVFISILGNPDQQKRGFQMLNEHRVRIQGLVARAIVLKYTPKLKFAFDESITRGNRVLQIIEELEKTTTDDDDD